MLVNNEFINNFPSSEVQHLIRHGFDQAPLLMNCESEEPIIKPFTFLNLLGQTSSIQGTYMTKLEHIRCGKSVC